MSIPRVLIVGGAPSNRRMLTRTLCQAGFLVSEAAGGSACLEQAVQTEPDLIILDVRLPDGYEVSRSLKQHRLTSRTPVLQIFAQSTEPKDLAQGLEGGADAYLVHPIAPLVLVSTVKALLRATHAEQELQRVNARLQDEIESRKQSELENQRRHALMSEAAKLSHTGAWEWDLSTDQWTFSDEWLRIHGCVAIPLTADELLSIAHPDDRAAIACTFERVRNGVSPYDMEHRIVRQETGEVRVVRERGQYVRDAAGKVTRIYGFAQDVTDRKRAEEEVLRSKDRLELFIRQAPVGLAMFDRSMRYVRVSDQWLRDVGLPEKSIVGKCHYNVFPNLPEHWKLAHARGLKGEVISSEEDWIAADGIRHTIRWALHPWGDSGNETGGIIIFFEDISDRKKAEEALRASEERFRSVLENMSEGLMLFDAKGDLIYQNPASLKIHGFGHQEEGRIGHEDLPSTWEAWDDKGRHISFDEWPICRVFRHERFQDQVLHVVRVETGQEFFGSYNGCPIYDADGRLTFGFITIREITEQVRAQTEVAASEHRLRLLIEANPMGVAIGDVENGRMLEANDAYLRIIGRDREELVMGEIDWIGMTPEEWLRLDERAIAQARERGTSDPYEKEYFRPDGSRVPVLVACSLPNKKNETMAFVADLTEQKRAEKALRDSERRLRTIFESDMVGIIFWNMKGQITDANNKFLQMLGYCRDDVTAGRIAWAQMTPPEYRHLDEHALAELKSTGVGTPYEKEFIRKDGTRLPIIIGAAMLDDSHEQGVAFVLDIADRKLLENQRDRLLEAERFARTEAERALRVKDEFLSVVSHELRNPLNVLMGWTKLLGKGNVDISKAVQIISRSASSLNQIVSDLLDMSRIVSGKTKFEPERTDLIGLVGNLLDSERMAAEAKGIRLSTSLDCSLEPITCDPNRIQQIIHNLLSNAIKFTPACGEIRVDVTQLPTAVEICVKDSGQGIAADFLPYVFDRFRQADQSISRRHGGLGLGLSIVKHLVELHGGSVRAESEGEGRGATFIVSLP